MVLLSNIKTILNDVSFPAMVHSTLETDGKFLHFPMIHNQTQNCNTIRSCIYFSNIYFGRSIPPSGSRQCENMIGKVGYERDFAFTINLIKYIKIIIIPNIGIIHA
jgi:hypothetical protein